jgi:hypothetical protein
MSTSPTPIPSTGSSASGSPVVTLTDALVDDAAIFPPGNAPLTRAVTEHRAHRAAWYAPCIGPLLIRLSDADELHTLTSDGEGLATTLICPPTATADQIGAAVALLAEGSRVRVVGIEQPLPPDVVSADPAGRDRARARAEAAAVVRLGVQVWFETPQDCTLDGTAGDWLDAVQTLGAHAKYRTGGVRADLFPTEVQVATFILAATTRALPFKLTAGLHHAVRHTAADTGFEHHGVLNVLAATAAAIASAEPGGPGRPGDSAPSEQSTLATLVGLLAERQGSVLATQVAAPDAPSPASVRAAFSSFGCCGVTDPLDDLVGLGLLVPRVVDDSGTPTGAGAASRDGHRTPDERETP